ncbi:NADH-quinone oxidoreductase subunit N [Pilimelia columellifera]|uniref:NADH-quinone oxidoreductase subunit N n=1 Tax=Pilimelia columellifera subsp. columellifera TaxID=706583 RepID=A0ABN3NDT6_9ACTN
MTVDHLALLPLYWAAGTAVLALLVDLLAGRRAVTVAVTASGAALTGAAALWVGAGPDRASLCFDGCSYLATPYAGLMATLFALLTVGALGLAAPMLRDGPPPGEFCFLLACSMTGGVALGYAGDLVSLIVAVETLTLPLYVLVGLRGRRTADRAAAEGAVTFFVVSVAATAVALLGAALTYAATGSLRLSASSAAVSTILFPDATAPLAAVGATLLLAGLAFKVAAVPLHAWAPATYDAAPLPVAAYLSTASKLGGVVALVALWRTLPAERTGWTLAVLAAVTMTVGNLGALRQTRMVRLLAWSSVAQVGYLLAPLAALATAAGRADAVAAQARAAAIAYTIFFLVIEFGAFAAVTALRGPGRDGGDIAGYTGVARTRRALGAALALALVGLAGLPPGLAGLFGKATVIRALLDGGLAWLALLLALNVVIGLAYYLRLVTTLYLPPPAPADAPAATAPVVAWSVSAAIVVATATAVAVGFAPQLVFDLAALT